MKIYVTKYALTHGIEVYENAEVDGKGFAAVRPPKSYRRLFRGEGKEWHKTKEKALVRCEEMRARKLASLERQIKKVSNIVFDREDLA